jgi:hypothetical protein
MMVTMDLDKRRIANMTEVLKLPNARPVSALFSVVQHKKSLQNTMARSYDPMNLLVSKDYSFEVRQISPREAFMCLNFLFAKIKHEGTEFFNIAERAVILEMFRITRSCTDLSFVRSYSLKLDRLQFVYDCAERARRIGSSVSSISKILHGYKFKEFLYSAHSYFGLKNKIFPMNLIRKIDRTRNRKPPPKSHIGVGYRDQGTCRKPELDGSQTWQEIASAKEYQSKFSSHSNQWSAPDIATFTAWGRHPERRKLLKGQ